MRFLFLGDVMGRSGRNAVINYLPSLRQSWKLDFVVVNGENAAGGFGITEKIFNDLIDAGADVITLGNHAFDQRDTQVFINRNNNLIRPINMPEGTPGRGAGLFKARNGADVLVINALGRVFMADLDCPFRAIDREVTACTLSEKADSIFVDFHAEATSEKQALGTYLDGRVSIVAGTHTHSPTCDHRILPNGTAYQSDVGMCGDYNSVVGMDASEPINRFITRIPRERFEPALGLATICGLAIDIDDQNGLAQKIGLVRIGGVLTEETPAFWTL